jgi:hypothetical protein
MPVEVIDQVHVLARRNTGNGTPELMFTDRDGASLTNPEDDDSDNESYYPDEDANSSINEYNDDYYQTSDAENIPDAPIAGVYDEEHLTGYENDDNARRNPGGKFRIRN